MEGFLLLIRRLSTPGRWSDLEREFGRPKDALSRIFVTCINWMYNRFFIFLFLGQMNDLCRWHELLNFRYLSNYMLQKFAAAFVAKGAPIDNLWGLIDGTLRQVY
eukprot:Pompholyxophrys_punicea_v1_NODE_499_length_1832_cov_7.614519.p2 type:complete len:105 gc:universal NODE_499_length_1832_cov_7.614519:1055-741(-)